MVSAHFSKRAPDLKHYTEYQIEFAKQAFEKFIKWFDVAKPEIILTETPFVSEKFEYGGTLDMLVKIGSQNWLIDVKTGDSIYPEMGMQLSALRTLLEENGYKVDECAILRLGRDEKEDYELARFSQKKLDIWMDRFLCLRDDYKLEKDLSSPAFEIVKG